MKQLVMPNLNITYRGGWCQQANENTVGQNGVYPSAYKAWLANVQHREFPPSGIYAPIYLNMPNGPKDPDGTQQDDVALICPDGTVAAAALPGVHTGLYKYPSLQAYINDYAKNNGGATYRGYGEYIGKLKVIGDNMKKNEAYKIVKWDYLMGTGIDPTPEQAESWANAIVANPAKIDELGKYMYDQVNKRIKEAGGAQYEEVTVYRKVK